MKASAKSRQWKVVLKQCCDILEQIPAEDQEMVLSGLSTKLGAPITTHINGEITMSESLRILEREISQLEEQSEVSS